VTQSLNGDKQNKSEAARLSYCMWLVLLRLLV